MRDVDEIACGDIVSVMHRSVVVDTFNTEVTTTAKKQMNAYKIRSMLINREGKVETVDDDGSCRAAQAA